MASFFIALSKPQLQKRIFCNNFPKPLYHFSSFAKEHKPDPNPHHLTHESQLHYSHKTNDYKKVEALCKDLKFNEAKQLIYNLVQKGMHKNEDLFILLINAYSNIPEKYNAYQNSVKIFKNMDKFGIPKTVKSYNHLFHVILRAQMCARAAMFFDKMLDERVDPDMDTYRIIISGLCRCYAVIFANKPFQHMKSRKISPDIVIYNSMINGYIEFDMMDEAEKIIVEMKGGNIKPDVNSYNLLIDGYAQVWKMEDVERLVVEMKGGNIEPNLVTYNAMVDGYAQVRKMEDVERLVVEMKGRNIEPDLMTYNAMIDGYFLLERLEHADKVFMDMKDRRIEPDVFTYVTMIKGYVKAERLDNGLELLEEMKGKKFGENMNILSCLGRLKEDCDADDVWESLGSLKKDLDAENMSETQQSVLQGVKDYVERLELLARQLGVK